MRRALRLAPAFVWLVTTPAIAQHTRGDSLLAARDTAAALAAYENAIHKDFRNAELHYRVGRLYLTQIRPRDRVSDERSKALEHFRLAQRFQPDSAKYVLALAAVGTTRARGDVRPRFQAGNANAGSAVERARDLSRLHGGLVTADIEWEAAQQQWRRYERQAHSHLVQGTLEQELLQELAGRWPYLQDYFEYNIKWEADHGGLLDRTRAENSLRAVLAADQRKVNAAGLLIVLLGDERRWEEAVQIAHNLIRAVPDSGRAYALLGLVHTRRMGWIDAAAAFREAFRRMSESELAPYADLGRILRGQEAAQFRRLPGPERARFDSLYWVANQPLYLNELIETRTEFYARVTYVLHRWGNPAALPASEGSSRSALYLRYGPPDIAGGGRTAIVAPSTTGTGAGTWIYAQARLVFSLGGAAAPGSGDYQPPVRDGNTPLLTYDETREVHPVRWDNLPLLRGLDTIAVQVAQFRGRAADATDVAVFAQTPIGRMAAKSPLADVQVVTAAIVKDSAWHDVDRRRTDEMVKGGDTLQVDRRTWRLALPPEHYRLQVETILPAIDRAARSSAPLTVRSYTADTLMISDIVVAGNIVPRDSAPTRWTDFFFNPSSGRLLPGEEIGLLWETYNLVPDSAGLARYRVEVRFTVLEIERRTLFARIMGGIGDAVGLSSQGDDRVSLTYERTIQAPQEQRAVEYLMIDLENAQEATYDITVTITDLNSGRALVQDRGITITRSRLTR